MVDINTVALIVMLNDPGAKMQTLPCAPVARDRWRLVAAVAMLIGMLLLGQVQSGGCALC